ncbi:MAG: hypothetical protein ACYCYF_13305, partial [Anaerolineae bacterium]
MTFLPALLTGVMLGAVAISLHMMLLHRAVVRVTAAQDTAARGYIVRSAPIRILLWIPFLFAAAQMGLTACLGALASMLVGRAIWVGRYWPDV